MNSTPRLQQPNVLINLYFVPTSFAVLLLLLMLLLLAGCGKEAQEKTTAERLKNAYSTLDKQQEAEIVASRKPADYMEDIKAQLGQPKAATNDAAPSAAIVVGKSKSETLLPAAIEPAPTTAAPIKPAVPVASPVATVAPAALTAATSTAPVTESPKLKIEPTLVPNLPISAPATATAVPARVPSSENLDRLITPINKREPEFPLEAKQRGIETGVVRARATVNSAGQVTRVEILSANPLGVFNRSVSAALRLWTFNPGANDRIYESEFTFRQ
jgi:TonB family protein